MRYCDFASTHASNAYMEFQQHAAAEADREQRDLLETCWPAAADPPAAAGRGPGVRAGRADPGARGDRDAGDLGTPTRRTSPPRRWPAPAGRPAGHWSYGAGVSWSWWPHCARPTRRPTPPRSATGCRDPAPAADGRGRAGDGDQYGRGRDGRDPAGVSGGERGAGRRGVDGGVVALPRLSPFDYLALSADDTARQLVDPRIAGSWRRTGSAAAG